MSKHNYTRNQRVKLPSDVFNHCPECESRELLKFEGEAFCLSCDWDSIIVHADAVSDDFFDQKQNEIADRTLALPYGLGFGQKSPALEIA